VFGVKIRENKCMSERSYDTSAIVIVAKDSESVIPVEWGLFSRSGAIQLICEYDISGTK
jgi:hypothetical protein